MNNPLSDTTFSFSPPIDGHYLFDLYAGDYVMIEETFADVLKDYDGFVQVIFSSYQSKNIPALKSAVHKIKPLFGFVGLLSIQAQCQDFENACQRAEFPELARSFNALKISLLEARSIIDKDKTRLTAYNLSQE
jgi:HPt (histidine-containing phosphotransfer) domain-containing protein